MHCNGKCQLMKKLQQEEKKDQENPERKTEIKNEIVLFTESFFETIPDSYTIIRNSKKSLLISGKRPVDRSIDIFHPPKGCSLT